MPSLKTLMDINSLDSNLYHLINQGTANGIFDVLMPFLSAKGYTLIFPFGAYMLWLAYRKEKRVERSGIWPSGQSSSPSWPVFCRTGQQMS